MFSFVCNLASSRRHQLLGRILRGVPRLVHRFQLGLPLPFVPYLVLVLYTRRGDDSFLLLGQFLVFPLALFGGAVGALLLVVAYDCPAGLVAVVEDVELLGEKVARDLAVGVAGAGFLAFYDYACWDVF